MSAGRSSRQKTGKQAGALRGHRQELVARPGGCPCRACLFDDRVYGPRLATLVEIGQHLLTLDDPLDAEMVGLVAAFSTASRNDQEDVFLDKIVPRLERTRSPAAVAALAAVQPTLRAASPADAEGARAAADRLTAAGIAAPPWADDLSQPATGERFQQLSGAGLVVLVGVFRHPERRDAFLLIADPAHCGAAAGVHAVPEDGLPEVLDQLREIARDAGGDLLAQDLEPDEYRWRVENALAARVTHDRQEQFGTPLSLPLADPDLRPTYIAKSSVLNARLQALPAPGKPPAPHGARHNPLLDNSVWAAGGQHGAGGQQATIAARAAALVAPEPVPPPAPAPA